MITPSPPLSVAPAALPNAIPRTPRKWAPMRSPTRLTTKLRPANIGRMPSVLGDRQHSAAHHPDARPGNAHGKEEAHRGHTLRRYAAEAATRLGPTASATAVRAVRAVASPSVSRIDL